MAGNGMDELCVAVELSSGRGHTEMEDAYFVSNSIRLVSTGASCSGTAVGKKQWPNFLWAAFGSGKMYYSMLIVTAQSPHISAARYCFLHLHTLASTGRRSHLPDWGLELGWSVGLGCMRTKGSSTDTSLEGRHANVNLQLHSHGNRRWLWFYTLALSQYGLSGAVHLLHSAKYVCEMISYRSLVSKPFCGNIHLHGKKHKTYVKTLYAH